MYPQSMEEGQVVHRTRITARALYLKADSELQYIEIEKVLSLLPALYRNHRLNSFVQLSISYITGGDKPSSLLNNRLQSIFR